MNNNNKISAQFIRSFAHYKDIFKPREKEYCILGRSNVGKSSFINHILGNQKLARVSKKPGKTSLANFYRLSNNTVWVDMPGYGFAKVEGNEKERWARLISEYCEKREGLSGIIWLLDIRHPGTGIDREAFEWMNSLNVGILPVLTKCDKLSKNLRARNTAKYAEIFKVGVKPVQYSIMEPGVREKFWKAFNVWSELSEQAGDNR